MIDAENFQKTLLEYDEIEFSYAGVQYDFQKENAAADLKLSVWRFGDETPCYCVEIPDDLSTLKKAVRNLIDAKILFDGKSIAEAEKDIDVEFFT